MGFDSWRGAAPLPPKPIVLSFDDGYLSDVKVALPDLKARGWPGVLNLEVANLKPVWGTFLVTDYVKTEFARAEARWGAQQYVYRALEYPRTFRAPLYVLVYDVACGWCGRTDMIERLEAMRN